MATPILTTDTLRAHDIILKRIIGRLEAATSYHTCIAQCFDRDDSPTPVMGPAHLSFAMAMGDLADSLEALDLSGYVLPSAL